MTNRDGYDILESFFFMSFHDLYFIAFGWFFAKCPLFTPVEVNLSMSYPSRKLVMEMTVTDMTAQNVFQS